MSLTVETGEGLANADSLVTLAEVRAFASSRGFSLSAVDATLEPLVRKAHDYLIARESLLQGTRRLSTQALPFPRTGVVLYGARLVETVVPTQIKNVIGQLLCDGLSFDLMPSAESRTVVKETVGPISTEYADTGVTGGSPSLPRVDAFLDPFLRNGGGFSLRTQRV